MSDLYRLKSTCFSPDCYYFRNLKYGFEIIPNIYNDRFYLYDRFNDYTSTDSYDIKELEKIKDKSINIDLDKLMEI